MIPLKVIYQNGIAIKTELTAKLSATDSRHNITTYSYLRQFYPQNLTPVLKMLSATTAASFTVTNLLRGCTK